MRLQNVGIPQAENYGMLGHVFKVSSGIATSRRTTMSIPRSEYPCRKFVRAQWLCLNGEWQFEIDHGDSGLERGLRESELAPRIQVPFCPESSQCGIA